MKKGFYSRRLLFPKESVPREGTLVVEAGRVQEIEAGSKVSGDISLYDFGNSVLMPGLVDTHVHLNEPGRTHWEGFESGSKAALAGGITTLVDMPLNSIPATISRAALEVKKDCSRGKCFCDYGFWGGVIPGNEAELEGLKSGGVKGFKVFLVESGVAEFPFSSGADLRKIGPLLKKLNLPLLVHAELDVTGPQPKQQTQTYQTFLASRPEIFELEAIRLMISLVREFGFRCHIVHLSSAQSLDLISGAKNEGLPFTVETCPHYLLFAAESIPPGNTLFKCTPPIRDQSNQNQLWDALKSGVIDFVVSDHSPCNVELKLLESGNFAEAWGGIASLQFGLPMMWDAFQSRGFSLGDLNRIMGRAPAQWLGLEQKKGSFRKGMDADIVVWNPEQEVVVELSSVLHKNKMTPYLGKRGLGLVEKTFVRGELVWDNGIIGEPRGQMI